MINQVNVLAALMRKWDQVAGNEKEAVKAEIVGFKKEIKKGMSEKEYDTFMKSVRKVYHRQ